MLWLLSIVCVALFCYFYVKLFAYWQTKDVKQASTWTCCWEATQQIFKLKSVRDIHLDNYFRFPKSRYIGLYQFSQPILMVRDPELLKNITVKDMDHFTDRQSFVLPGNDPFWDNNLFALGGDQWRTMRATLSPAFTATKMKAMFVLMNETAQEYTSYFMQGGQQGAHQMKDSYRRYANDIIANCAFGYKCDSLTDRNNEFYQNGLLISNFSSFWRSLKLALGLVHQRIAKLIDVKAFDPNVSAFFFDIVKKQLDIRQKQNIVRPDMLNLLLEARKGQLKHETGQDKGTDAETGFATVEESDIGKSSVNKKIDFSDVEITAQALFFFAAGFDTVSSAMSFISYELALHPEIQQRLREEIDATNKKCNGILTYETLFGMKYMDMVISEALRKWPPALFVDRKIVKTYKIERSPGFEDEADELILDPASKSAILIPINPIHHDPQNYPNPDVFDPERFNDENKKNIKPFTYLPFGLGPRSCVGSRFALMEMKTLFYHLLSKFEIVVDTKTQIPVQLSKGLFNLDSTDGIWLCYKKRN